jgi:hypothetical protein
MPGGHVLGISRSVFLAERMQPTSPNHPFYNDACPFGWDTYHEGHRAVRIILCNLVFGSECVQVMVNSENCDFCPLCRTRLFTASWTKLAFELMRSLVAGLVMRSYAAWAKLPPRIQMLSEQLPGLVTGTRGDSWTTSSKNTATFLFAIHSSTRNHLRGYYRTFARAGR